MTLTQLQAFSSALYALEAQYTMAANDQGDYVVDVTPKLILDAVVKVKAALAEPEEVPALVDRLKALEEWLLGDANCPCCDQYVECLTGCTFHNDEPWSHEKMRQVRNILKAQ